MRHFFQVIDLAWYQTYSLYGTNTSRNIHNNDVLTAMNGTTEI